MKFKNFMLLLLFSNFSLSAQQYNLKREITEVEANQLISMFDDIGVADQKYRSYLSHNTLEDSIIERFDEIYEEHGIEAAFQYEKSLNLELSKEVKDSLWDLQHQMDFENHMKLRGVFAEYGFPGEELLGEKSYMPLILLMHPPAQWDVEIFLESYIDLLMPEVEKGRMPAEIFAKFVDNINGKILRRPQIYGTNKQFDVATNSVLPPAILNLNLCNQARNKIGLPSLVEGEYRIVDSDK